MWHHKGLTQWSETLLKGLGDSQSIICDLVWNQSLLAVLLQSKGQSCITHISMLYVFWSIISNTELEKYKKKLQQWQSNMFAKETTLSVVQNVWRLTGWRSSVATAAPRSPPPSRPFPYRCPQPHLPFPDMHRGRFQKVTGVTESQGDKRVDCLSMISGRSRLLQLVCNHLWHWRWIAWRLSDSRSPSLFSLAPPISMTQSPNTLLLLHVPPSFPTCAPPGLLCPQ